MQTDSSLPRPRFPRFPLSLFLAAGFASLALIPSTSRGINVSIDAGPVGTVHSDTFSQDFTEANGLSLDGTNLNLEFTFTGDTAIRFDYTETNPFSKIILVDIKLWHDLGAFPTNPGPQPSNLVRLNGALGSPSVQEDGFQFSGTGNISGEFAISVEPMMDDDEIVPGYTFSGVTMNLLLPSEMASITNASFKFFAYGASDGEFTVVPEPTVSTLTSLALLGALSLRRSRSC